MQFPATITDSLQRALIAESRLVISTHKYDHALHKTAVTCNIVHEAFALFLLLSQVLSFLLLLLLLPSGACQVDVAVSTSSRHADLSIARRLAVAGPKLSGRRSSSTVLSQVCLGLPTLLRQSFEGLKMQA